MKVIFCKSIVLIEKVLFKVENMKDSMIIKLE